MGIYKSEKGKAAILSLYEKQLKRIKEKYEDIYFDTSFNDYYDPYDDYDFTNETLSVEKVEEFFRHEIR